MASRRGRVTSSPEQFGQAPSSSAQAEQNVHSKLQIRAVVESAGSAVWQRSQSVRISSMGPPYAAAMAVDRTRKGRAARKRKRRMDRVEHDLTTEQWDALVAAWGGCAYCGVTGKPLQRDCVLALSRGGRYTIDNIVPACRSCNASKCNDEVTGWLRRKRLDERAFLLRHVEVRRSLIT